MDEQHAGSKFVVTVSRGGVPENLHVFDSFEDAHRFVREDEDLVASGPWYEGDATPATLDVIDERYYGFFRANGGDVEVRIDDAEDRTKTRAALDAILARALETLPEGSGGEYARLRTDIADLYLDATGRR